MTWISTASGKKIDFLAPEIGQIDIEDIASGLAAMPRWAGQTLTRRAEPCHYSVAQHSWLCSRKFDDAELALTGLLHDATEAYMGDCPRPLKDLFGRTWIDVERRLLVAIFERFGLAFDRELAPRVKLVDDRLLMTERRDLQPFCPPWDSGPWPEPFDDLIEPWPYAIAREQFLNRFHKLHATVRRAGWRQFDREA